MNMTASARIGGGGVSAENSGIGDINQRHCWHAVMMACAKSGEIISGHLAYGEIMVAACVA